MKSVAYERDAARVAKPRITRWLDWPKWLTFGLVFLGFLYVGISRIDFDFGWHLREGRELIAGTYDGGHYSYTAPDYDWSAHEWLSDIVLASIYDFGGYYLLAVVYAALYTLAFYWVARDKLGIITFLAMLVSLPFAGIRTLVWSLLGLAALYKIFHAKKRRWRLLVPPLIWLWSALHGSFLLGIVYVGYYFIKERDWRLFGLGALGAALTLIGPFGIRLYHELALTMFDGELAGQVGEWQSGIMGNPLAITLLAVLWATSFFDYRLKHPRSFRQLVGQIKPFWRFDLIMLLLSLRTIRYWPLFALLAMPETDRGIRQVATVVAPYQKQPRNRRIVRGMVVGLVSGVLAATIYNIVTLPKPLGLAKIEARDFPVSAKDYLAEHGCEGNLFNHYNYGGWLAWRLPEVPTYIDGRMPSWRRPADTTVGAPDERYMSTYVKVMDDPATRAAEFAKWNVTCVLIPVAESNIYSDLSNNPAWALTVNDPASAVLFIKQ